MFEYFEKQLVSWHVFAGIFSYSVKHLLSFLQESFGEQTFFNFNDVQFITSFLH